MRSLFLGLMLGAVAGSAVAAPPAAAPTTNDVTELESLLHRLQRPVHHVPFATVLRATTGCRLLALDTNQTSHAQLCRALRIAAARAMRRARAEGIATARANEAGNRMEKFVLAALQAAGLPARVPVNAAGRTQATGYPDIEITAPAPCYLELKTYSAKTANTTQRSFYFSPSATPKVTHDALHLLLAYQLARETRAGRTIFVPEQWQLRTLEDLTVDLKFEFNQSNRHLYGRPQALIGAGKAGHDGAEDGDADR